MENFHLINRPSQSRDLGDLGNAITERKDYEAIPVSIDLENCTDAADRVEKDGTGIGTGADQEYHPVLGSSYDLAQDVAPEQGSSTNSENVFEKASYGLGRNLLH